MGAALELERKGKERHDMNIRGSQRLRASDSRAVTSPCRPQDPPGQLPSRLQGTSCSSFLVSSLLLPPVLLQLHSCSSPLLPPEVHEVAVPLVGGDLDVAGAGLDHYRLEALAGDAQVAEVPEARGGQGEEAREMGGEMGTLNPGRTDKRSAWTK